MIRLPRLSRRMLASLGLVLVAGAALGLGRERIPEMTAWTIGRMEDAQRALGLVVARVEIAGRRLTPVDAVAAAVGPVEGRLLSRLDLAAVRTRLEEISWVAKAEALRVWPDRLKVNLTEREPFALWQERHGKALVLVDAHGVVLTHDGLARWRHLPLLVGEGAPQAAPPLLALLEETPDLARRVSAMLHVGERRWDIEMDNGIRVKLPAADTPGAEGYGPEKAWRRFAALEQRHRLLARAVSVIDLRLSDRLTVRLSPQGRSLGLAEGPGASI